MDPLPLGPGLWSGRHADATGPGGDRDPRTIDPRTSWFRRRCGYPSSSPPRFKEASRKLSLGVREWWVTPKIFQLRPASNRAVIAEFCHHAEPVALKAEGHVLAQRLISKQAPAIARPGHSSRKIGRLHQKKPAGGLCRIGHCWGVVICPNQIAQRTGAKDVLVGCLLARAAADQQ